MDNTNDTDYQLFVGIDRSDTKLDIAYMDPQGNTTHLTKISTRPEGLLEWVQALRGAGARVIGLE